MNHKYLQKNWKNICKTVGERSYWCSILTTITIHIHNTYTFTNISGNIVNNNDELQWTNQHTSLLRIYLYSRKGAVSCVWELSWRRGQTATYWPKVLLTIAVLLSHPGWAAQPWVTEGPRPLFVVGSHSAGILSANGTHWPKPSVAPGYIIVCRPPDSCGCTHLPPSPNSTTSTGQGDIPISSTGYTCFAVLRLIYTSASLDWRLGRGSICYIDWKPALTSNG